MTTEPSRERELAPPPTSHPTLAQRITPGDPCYDALVRRGFNRRFVPRPDYVRLVASTADVVDAVREAVRDARRLAVRSGGHCLEGFVGDPAVRALIDTSPMDAVYFDPAMDAFAVEAGARLGDVYRALAVGWNVLLPAGQAPAVGVGGHIAGAPFGFLHRRHGLAVEYLYAVEVVVVDADGAARPVIATREPDDPNHELWWAHTGGGAGNFGVLTRCWFRGLPRAPASVHVFRVSWPWPEIDEAAFTTLVRNHGEWCERNASASLPSADLFSVFLLARRAAGAIELKGLCIADAASRQVVDAHVAAITRGVGAAHTRADEALPWLDFATDPFPELFAAPPGGVHVKVKDALLRRRLTDGQIAVAYDYLTRTDYDVVGGGFGLATYGGRVNDVAPDATAAAHRTAILDTACSVGWVDPREAAPHLAWVRAFYRDLFADSGGVPVPGAIAAGALINHPDVDLDDPAWNTSGVPWSTLYYRDNYPRLQRIKARWDPRDVFRHALGVRPA
jgi:FAD/FMN-containing dehydrogenase